MIAQLRRQLVDSSQARVESKNCHDQVIRCLSLVAILGFLQLTQHADLSLFRQLRLVEEQAKLREAELLQSIGQSQFCTVDNESAPNLHFVS